MQPLHLIYARAANGVIGKDNTMPWHLPEDMAHFKQLTQGCAVIMGRKTWDSLPPRFRPLPGRTNIVVTRQSDWQAEGALRADSLEGALALARAATTDEVKVLRKEARDLKEVVAEQALELRLLKKSMIADGGDDE